MLCTIEYCKKTLSAYFRIYGKYHRFLFQLERYYNSKLIKMFSCFFILFDNSFINLLYNTEVHTLYDTEF